MRVRVQARADTDLVPGLSVSPTSFCPSIYSLPWRHTEDTQGAGERRMWIHRGGVRRRVDGIKVLSDRERASDEGVVVAWLSDRSAREDVLFTP